MYRKKRELRQNIHVNPISTISKDKERKTINNLTEFDYMKITIAAQRNEQPSCTATNAKTSDIVRPSVDVKVCEMRRQLFHRNIKKKQKNRSHN